MTLPLKISVVTPSYNQGRFIDKCIDSVKLQQGVHVEHIILDNCSTDQTIEVLRDYPIDRQRVDVKIIVESDNGQTDAINRGFLLATGDIVCWLNTDEYYYPGALLAVANFFSNHPEVDVLFGDCTFVDQAGTVVKEKREFGFSKNMLIYYGCYIPSCSTFVRRRVIDQGHLLDNSFKVCMDFDWYLRIVKAGYKIAHIPISLALFTWHETNISRKFARKRVEEEQRLQLIYGGGIGADSFRINVFRFAKLYYYCFRVLARVRWRHLQGMC